MCQFEQPRGTTGLGCQSPSSQRTYFDVVPVPLEAVGESYSGLQQRPTRGRRYSIPIDRFWTADQQDLIASDAAACRGLYVEVNLQTASDGIRVEEELVGRNVTAKVVKATLCYPDSLKAKNDFIDVL